MITLTNDFTQNVKVEMILRNVKFQTGKVSCSVWEKVRTQIPLKIWVICGSVKEAFYHTTNN